MKKVIIAMSIVFGLALGGVFHIASFIDVTPEVVACDMGKGKGSAEGGGTSDDAGTET